MKSDKTLRTEILPGILMLFCRHRKKARNLATASLLAIVSCGVADPNDPGRCAVVSDADGIAPSTDTEGNAWKFESFPSEVSLQCYTPEARGVIQIVTKIRDGRDQPAAGISVGASLPQGVGLEFVTEDNLEAVRAVVSQTSSFSFELVATDTATDECGVAIFTIVYTCPTKSIKALGGPFVAYSGALFSEPVSILVTLSAPEVDPAEEEQTQLLRFFKSLDSEK